MVVTLISNFGTFLLYMLTCIIAIVAFREHHTFSGFKHMFVPLFGLVANLLCMLFYLVGPFTVSGMSVKEPYIALGGLRGLGHLRRRLLRALEQGEGEGGLMVETARQTAVGVLAARGGRGRIRVAVRVRGGRRLGRRYRAQGATRITAPTPSRARAPVWW